MPQGSVCSPVLATGYAHCAIDEWFEGTVRHHCPTTRLYRYCDDLVIGCSNSRDAQRISKALAGRLARFNLRLNMAKSRSVVVDKRALLSGRARGTFDFLGFTFYLGRTRKGTVVPKVKTSSRRYLRGPVQYFGVSNNLFFVRCFIAESIRIFF